MRPAGLGDLSEELLSQGVAAPPTPTLHLAESGAELPAPRRPAGGESSDQPNGLVGGIEGMLVNPLHNHVGRVGGQEVALGVEFHVGKEGERAEAREHFECLLEHVDVRRHDERCVVADVLDLMRNQSLGIRV